LENKSKLAPVLDYIPEGLFPHHTSAPGSIQASLLDIKHKCAPMPNNPKLKEKVETIKLRLSQNLYFKRLYQDTTST
jgi:hypothetical protein